MQHDTLMGFVVPPSKRVRDDKRDLAEHLKDHAYGNYEPNDCGGFPRGCAECGHCWRVDRTHPKTGEPCTDADTYSVLDEKLEKLGRALPILKKLVE